MSLHVFLKFFRLDPDDLSKAFHYFPSRNVLGFIHMIRMSWYAYHIIITERGKVVKKKMDYFLPDNRSRYGRALSLRRHYEKTGFSGKKPGF
jgi:hypothetical protein